MFGSDYGEYAAISLYAYKKESWGRKDGCDSHTETLVESAKRTEVSIVLLLRPACFF